MKPLAFVLVALVLSPSVASSQSPTRAQLQANIEKLRAELVAREAEFLAPSPADVAAYPGLMHQDGSGVIRLLSREAFDSPKKLTLRGGGAYYSFTRLTHEYGNGSDIELANGEFGVGFAGADYGFIAKLENVSILNVELDTPGVATLAARTTPTLEARARDEHRLAREGLTLGNTSYRNRVPVEVGASYVLRSVSYGESDVVVCFEVLRKDEDGSVVLAWRMLKRLPVPELIAENGIESPAP